jgi:hypothetical protein
MGGGAADGFLMMMVMGAVVMMMREWITETIHAIVGYLFVSIEISDADSSEVCPCLTNQSLGLVYCKLWDESHRVFTEVL